MTPKQRKSKGSENVVLTELPPGLVDGLLKRDQKAIREIVGKPILLVGYDKDNGRAELQFGDINGGHHYIYVDPKFIRRA